VHSLATLLSLIARKERKRTKYAIVQSAMYEVTLKLSNLLKNASGHRSVIEARIQKRRSRKMEWTREGAREWTTLGMRPPCGRRERLEGGAEMG
jgi:aspartokinase